MALSGAAHTPAHPHDSYKGHPAAQLCAHSVHYALNVYAQLPGGCWLMLAAVRRPCPAINNSNPYYQHARMTDADTKQNGTIV